MRQTKLFHPYILRIILMDRSRKNHYIYIFSNIFLLLSIEYFYSFTFKK